MKFILSALKKSLNINDRLESQAQFLKASAIRPMFRHRLFFLMSVIYNKTRKHITRFDWMSVTALVCAPVAVLLLYFQDPQSSSLFPPCPFHFFTGLYCPGCGSLRAAHQLLHGNILAALDYNIMLVAFAPFLLTWLVNEFFFLLTGKKLINYFLRPFYIWIIFFLITTFAIIRNLPFYPFTILAP